MEPEQMNEQIVGVGTAMLTPFRRDGAVDLECLERFVEFQVTEGVNFLVPVGTTGEAPTLTEDEQCEVIQTTMRVANGRVPVVAGCSSYSTLHAIERARRFKSIGVTHILTTTPYYNKPTQEGIYRHYAALKEDTGLQIMAYSIPGRTGVNITPDTMERLVRDGIVFGVKEASGNILQIQEICQRMGSALKVLSGDDTLLLPTMAVGAVGVISVPSNVVPRAMRAWMDTMIERNYVKARAQLQALRPLIEACAVETNPIPVKGAAAILGLMDATFRLPMTPPAEKTMGLLRDALQHLKGA
ncbi:MAG TPA: 4-hydroxy-tetrahydrodipicolinate synthase [bacterium]